MKALIYKEFKLAMHPICYVFIAMFPFMILIPSYPLAIGFVYVLSCYPILFLGANKGQQSNDLLYSTLLPIRKKDIVLARIITVLVMQLAFMLIMSALAPLAYYMQQNVIIEDSGEHLVSPGIPLEGFVSLLGIAIIGFAIADLIFFPIYYKNGKSIVLSTLMTILGFIIYLGIFTIAFPYIPGFEWYGKFLWGSGLGVQFIVLGVAIVISFFVHLLTEQVDF